MSFTTTSYTKPSSRRTGLTGCRWVLGIAAACSLFFTPTLGDELNAGLQSRESGSWLSGAHLTRIPLSKVKRAAAAVPAVGTSWQIVLQNPLKMSSSKMTPDVSVYDIDLFTNSQATISALKAQKKFVICYFSAGSYEPYRPDSSQFLPGDKGSVLEGWEDEKWLNIKSANVRTIMSKRIKLAASKGCDAVDPDNVDGYSNKNGLGLTKDDQINYIKFLAQEASASGLRIGLKNAGDLISSVLGVVHFAVNEQCAQYNECSLWNQFIRAGKPVSKLIPREFTTSNLEQVFRIEYPNGAPTVSQSLRTTKCATTGSGKGSDGFSTVLKVSYLVIHLLCNSMLMNLF